MADVDPSTSAPRRRHRVRRYFAIFGIALVVLLLLALGALHTPPARRFVQQQVTALLQQQNIEFNTDELRYNLFDLRLALRNVRIRSQAHPDLPPFASIDRVNLDLSLTRLIRGRYVLQSGEAEGVAVHYFVAADGRDNLPRPPSDPNQPSQPLDYLVDSLQVTNARVRYENHAQRIDFSVPVTTMEVDGNPLNDRHTVRIDAGRGKIAVQDRKATLEYLKGEVDLGDDDVAINGIDAAAEGARLHLTGAITQFASPHGDLALRGSVDAARAAAIAGLDEQVSGNVALDVTAKGPLTAPAIAGRISGERLAFRGLSDVSLATLASYDMTKQLATIDELQLRAPFGQLNGRGAVSLTPAHASQISATASGIDTASLMRAFNLPYVVASRVDAQVQAEWPGIEYLKASGSARATLTPTARASRSVIPVGGRIDVTGRASAIDAVLTRVTTAGAEVNGRVRVVNQEQLAGDARIHIGDLSQTIATAEALLGRPAGTLIPTRLDGSATAETRLAGTVSAPVVHAQLNAPNLVAGTASGIALNGDLTYSPDLVTVRQLDVQWQKARANVSGTVGLTGPRPLNLAFNADAIEVTELLRALDRTDVPASGTLYLQGKVAGTATQPAVNATLRGDNLTAYQETWGTLSARADMKGREVIVSNLALDKPQANGNGRIAGSASYHLDRRTYAVDLRSQNLRLTSLTLPNGRQLRGTLQLTARGAGSIDRPAGTINLIGEELQLDQYAIGRLNADATIANQQATITAAVPNYGTNLDAVIGTSAPYPTTAKLRVDNLQLATVPLKLATPLEGTVRATADARLDLQAPERAQVNARIDAFSGAWNNQPFRIDGPAVLRYANERVAIDQLRVIAQDSTVAVSGELPVTEGGAPGAISVDARANLATLARYAPAGTNVTASGELTLNGTIRGTLRAIDPDLTLIVANGFVTTPQIQPGLSNLNVRARVAGGEANIEQLAANFGTATIAATGRLPLEVVPQLPVDIPRRGGPATFTARVDGLDLSQVPGAPQGLTGRVSLAADLSATRADLAALEGRITFPELQLGFNGLTLAQQQVSSIALAGGVARVDQFSLSGSVGTIAARGTVGLLGDRPINVNADGNLNVAVISLFTDAVRAEGDTRLQLAATGTIATPEVNGFVDLNDATFVVDEPTVAAENVNARLDLSGRRITLSQLTGVLNGGSLTGSGFVELGGSGIADAALELKTDDVAFDAPLDLRSMSDAVVRLRRRENEYTIDGQITLDEAGLTGDINFDEGLLAAMQARRRLDLTEERNAFLESIRFDLDIDTASPIIVDNNLARAEVSADLRLLGTPYEPGLSGRLVVSEESEITLNERRYQVERGVITFIGERRIQPSFDLLLNTAARNYDITIAVTGTPGETETSLTSDPTLPEPDIMAILVTGRTLDEMRGEEFEVAQEQVLSYLAGRVGSQLGRGLQQATGLSTVRIEPNLIANEAEPTARLTLGQEVTDDLELIYSTNLTDSSDQIWVAEYDVTRRFRTRGVRQSDNSYRFDIRHDVRFGGQPAPRRIPRTRPDVGRVTITGDGRLPEAEIRQMVDIEPGDDYDFFKARDRVEEIEEGLEERNRLQSRVRLQREVKGNEVVDLSLRVNAGPEVELVFEGVTPPGGTIEEVRRQWRRGVFDTQRIDDGVEAIRAWLMQDNYLQPKVEGQVEDVGPDRRRVRFRVEPGTRFEQVILAFEGASGVSPDTLDDIINEQDLEQQLFTDPVQVTELLERYYREQGFLVATVDEPRYEYQGTQARVVLAVNEGPKFTVRNVAASGVSVFPEQTLLAELPVQSGEPFLPFAAENALEHIRTVYWRRGYNDVREDYELVLDRKSGVVDVRFEIVEGPQSVIAGINIEGNDETSNRLVREQLELQEEQPLDLSALARSRRNLYDTQAFSIVDIERQEGTTAAGVRPVALNVSVREVQPVQLRYGVSFDTERGVGGIFDISNHNTLGKARVVGLRSRYDSQLKEARLYMSQPSLRYWPIQTTASIYYRDEANPETELTGRFDVDRRGASIQQERELRDQYVWSWGFRFERATTLDITTDGIVEETQRLTPLTTTFTRETRDEVLDATRGAFMSQAFAYSPSWLGSDQAFIRYLGQYFHYIPLQRERRERFTNEILRPRFVYAVGARVGLARGFGGLVPRAERFFAGGSTTLRGFEQNAVGPIGVNRTPAGGAAMLIINNELRFPLLSIFDGVVFSDIGNVFPRLADISFTDLRETAGVGLRARTPWFLLRGDYGILLDRRAGERRGRFYFSIGQAF